MKKKKLDFMEINIKQAHIVIFQIRKSIKISETDKKKVLASLTSFVIIRITKKPHVPLESKLDFLFSEFLYLKTLLSRNMLCFPS